MIPVATPPFPLIFAHRGGGAEAVENSLAAFEQLREAGIDHIETDVHLTRDGEVVISHDATIDRCFDGTGKISDYTLEELQGFRNAAGEPPQRLADVLEAFPDLYFNIDAKSDEVAEPLLQVIADAGAADRVMVASFSEKRLRRIRERGSAALSTSLGVGGIARLLFAAQTAFPAAAWGVPGPNEQVRAAQVPETTRGIRVVSPRFIAAAHNAGLAVHVWTVNEREQMERLLDWGVDGIVTDHPLMLKELLIERGQWPGDAPG